MNTTTISDTHGQPDGRPSAPGRHPVSRALGESFQHKDSELDAAVHSLLGTAGTSGKG